MKIEEKGVSSCGKKKNPANESCITCERYPGYESLTLSCYFFRYGIEGPVYLIPRGEKGGDWLVDEEHQRVTKADAGISYSILQAVKIHMEVVERQPNRPKLELTLI